MSDAEAGTQSEEISGAGVDETGGGVAKAAGRSVGAALDRLAPVEWRAGRSPIAVAVSGGSDSAALLVLAARRAAEIRAPLHAVTVDHQLRRESAAEAAAVAKLADSLVIPHVTLRWDDAAGEGGTPAAAREARYRLMADWARAEGIAAIAVAHSQDDVAETLLLRLARGSGVDGLSEMVERGSIVASDGEEVPLLRPCLEISRETLREVCRAADVAWFEDPTNDDPRYDRTLARKALNALAPMGVDRAGLAATARRLRRARSALEESTDLLIDKSARLCRSAGWVDLAAGPLAEAPREIALRALARLLEWVSGAPYPPRMEPLEALLDAVLEGEAGRTLHGVTLEPDGKGRWALCREAAAVAASIPVFQRAVSVWDRRWRFEVQRVETSALGGPLSEVRIGPLGDAGAAVLKAEAAGDRWAPAEAFAAAPRRARLATPALWSGDRLLAAPVAGHHAERLSLRLMRSTPHRSHRMVRSGAA